jgi:UPF0755 protein
VLLLGGPLAAWAYGAHLLSPMDSGPGAALRTVDIPPGANAAGIARRLRAARLIRSDAAFQLTARALGKSSAMKAGVYQLSPNLDVPGIIRRLVEGQSAVHWVVVPEGLTLRQIAQRFADRGLFPAEAFLEAARHLPAEYGLDLGIKRRSVDGYLMPDTYQFPRRTTPQAVIRVMLRNWREKVYRLNRERFARSGLSVDRVVVLASLIEREARVAQDRTLISSVIWNRLAIRKKLEIDATVLYALGRHKDRVLFRDLKVDSPYNTYRYPGLPPGPICNPGKACVDAALRPAETNFLYYVARPDGSHVFAATGQEHAANVAAVRSR